MCYRIIKDNNINPVEMLREVIGNIYSLKDLDMVNFPTLRYICSYSCLFINFVCL